MKTSHFFSNNFQFLHVYIFFLINDSNRICYIQQDEMFSWKLLLLPLSILRIKGLLEYVKDTRQDYTFDVHWSLANQACLSSINHFDKSHVNNVFHGERDCVISTDVISCSVFSSLMCYSQLCEKERKVNSVFIRGKIELRQQRLTPTLNIKRHRARENRIGKWNRRDTSLSSNCWFCLLKPFFFFLT